MTLDDTPTEHELHWNNICGNDSFSAPSRLYENTDEKITQIVLNYYLSQTVYLQELCSFFEVWYCTVDIKDSSIFCFNF